MKHQICSTDKIYSIQKRDLFVFPAVDILKIHQDESLAIQILERIFYILVRRLQLLVLHEETIGYVQQNPASAFPDLLNFVIHDEETNPYYAFHT